MIMPGTGVVLIMVVLHTGFLKKGKPAGGCSLGTRWRGVTEKMLDRIFAMAPHVLQSMADLIHQFGLSGAQRLPSTVELRTAAYTRYGSVALLSVHGVMVKRANVLTWLFGGTDMKEVERALAMAVADKDVRTILLHFDSPGGTAAGTTDLANAVFRARQSKRILAFCEDMCASAAYYVAAQAHQIIANESAVIGSIGTYTLIDDWSKFFEREGVKRTVVRFGKLKGAGALGTEVTEELLSELQKIVDSLGGLFVAGVSRGRKIPGEHVKGTLATGEVWIAARARQMGLIDRIGRLEDEIQLAQQDDGVDLRAVMVVAGGESVSTRSTKSEKVTAASVRPAGENPTRQGGKYPLKGRSYVGSYGS